MILYAERGLGIHPIHVHTNTKINTNTKYTGCSLNIVVFLKILKYSGLWPFSVLPLCQCVYTHKAGITPALQQNWQSSEKSQNSKEKTQYLMNTLYLCPLNITRLLAPRNKFVFVTVATVDRAGANTRLMNQLMALWTWEHMIYHIINTINKYRSVTVHYL